MRCPRCKHKTKRPEREDCRVCLDCACELNNRIAELVGTLVLLSVQPHARERDIQDFADTIRYYIVKYRRHLDISVLNAVCWFMDRWTDGRVPEALVL